MMILPILCFFLGLNLPVYSLMLHAQVKHPLCKDQPRFSHMVNKSPRLFMGFQAVCECAIRGSYALEPTSWSYAFAPNLRDR